ncbi:XRE family transcriptional regulator [Photobacterium sp. 1_MG-2023]|uniref:XRE family transcriptional regulator n=1 Tax=Photobacterium sp. 1_MG-2023 TaxID=3062646 RepID=UPI0026E40A21|nr:XRE family transcriptional regulator [Photobacterium sp. 1_MG-2023]MDO6708707.1 XRE family transcriptional regulator [Photobacterium sp. 1_MG-2023]
MTSDLLRLVLFRKYLNGSEPSLQKANQIAMKANCSLEWLATGCGYLYRQAEVVDQAALAVAFEHVKGQPFQRQTADEQTRILSGYQFLRTHKKADGYLDAKAMASFLALAKQEKPTE